MRPALRMLFGNSLCRSSGGLGRLNAGKLRVSMSVCTGHAFFSAAASM